jgi:Na+-transporting NADH:ubiquinone oxidoreductase subunit C
MKKHLYSIAYMFIITFFFAAAVSAVRLVSLERIKVNERAKITGIILDVLGIVRDKKMDAGPLVELFENRIRTITLGKKTLYAATGVNEKGPGGYAFEVSGPGFWGPIYGIAAVDARAERILGVRFYKHVETPGLGARISEKWFFDQFQSLPVTQPGENGRFFSLKRAGKSRAANELDAVTGATMTSQAVEEFLNRELHNVVPKIRELLKEG